MKKLLIAAALCVFGVNVMASDNPAIGSGAQLTTAPKPHSGTAPEILSIVTFNVTEGVSVHLPKWRMADGSICLSYVASASEANVIDNAAKPLNRVNVVMNQICGKAKVVAAGFFPNEVEEIPENLKALRTVTTGGLSFQKLELLVGN